MRAGVCALTNRAYNRGVDWERTLQRMLIAKGWKVIRSAGSHQAIDLIAGKMDSRRFQDAAKGLGPWEGVKRRLAIQCKTGDARWTQADKEATINMAKGFDAVPILAERRHRKRTYWILDETNDTRIEEAFFD